MIFESATVSPPGRVSAAARVAGDTRGGQSLPYIFSNVPFVGRTPGVKEFDEAAARDPEMAKKWQAYKDERARQIAMASRLYGENPDWNDVARRIVQFREQQDAEAGQAASAEPARKDYLPIKILPRPEQDHVTPLERKPFTSIGPLEQTARDVQLGRYGTEVTHGPPGITRPPWTEEEMAAAFWNDLHREGVAAQEKAVPDSIARRGIAGVGEGARLGTTFLAPAARGVGTLSSLVRGVAGGAAYNAATQALGLATGARAEPSLGEFLGEAALMGGASVAGARMARAFPKSPHLASTTGALSTFEGAGLAHKIITGDVGRDRDKSLWRSLAEHLAKTAATVGTAAAMHVGAPPQRMRAGRPVEAQPRIRTKWEAREEARQPFREARGKELARERAELPETGPGEAPPRAAVVTWAPGTPRRAVVTWAPGKPGTVVTREAGATTGIPSIPGKPAGAAPARPVGAPVGPVGAPARPLSDYESARAVMDGLIADIRSALRQPQDRSGVLKQIEIDLDAKLLPLVERWNAAKAATDRVLDRVAGKDAKLRRQIAAVGWIENQTDGRASSIFRGKLLPATFDEVVAVMREEGAVNLAIGRALWSVGLLPTARWRRIGAAADEPDVIQMRGEPTPGPGYELVGGRLFHEQRGQWMPIITAIAEETARAKKARGLELAGRGVLGAVRRRGGVESPLSSELLRRHLSGREDTPEEALAKRVLDTSLESMREVMGEELRAVRRMARMERLEREGLLLKERPQSKEQQQALKEARDLDAEIVKLRAAAKKAPPGTALDIAGKISAMIWLRESLRASVRANGGRRLVGSEWGRYEGYYLHPFAESQVRQSMPTLGDFEQLVSTITSTAKSMNVEFNLAQIMLDWVGNWYKMAQAGVGWVRAARETIRAAKTMATRRPRDATDAEFLAMESEASFGGASDVTVREHSASAGLARRIRERIEGGERPRMLQAAAVIQRVPEWWRRVPLLRRVSTARRAWVDEAAALAMFRVAKLRGIEDSGPMPRRDAFDFVRGVLDYSLLPRKIQKSAMFLNWVRWRAKVAQALLTKGLLPRPSILGVKIPTPMDRIIRDPRLRHTRKAQAALVTRGLAHVAMQAAHWMGVLNLAQRALLPVTGVSKEDLDRRVASNYRHAPDFVRWIMQQVALPVGRTKTGRVVALDGGQMNPDITSLMYFISLVKSTGPRTPLWWSLLQKNIPTGTGAQLVARRSYSYLPTDGFERVAPVLGLLVPATITRPINAYLAELDLPEDERSALRNFIVSVGGLPLKALDRPSPVEKLFDRWWSEGVIALADLGDGRWYYYVRPEKVNTASGIQAKQVLGMDEVKEYSFFSASRRAHRRSQQAMEQAQER